MKLLKELSKKILSESSNYTYAGRPVKIHRNGSSELDWEVEFIKTGRRVPYADAIANLKIKEPRWQDDDGDGNWYEDEDVKDIKEGYYSSSPLETVIGSLGYRQDFAEFFDDNPGAVDSVMEWIISINDFRNRLKQEFDIEELEKMGIYDLDEASTSADVDETVKIKDPDKAAEFAKDNPDIEIELEEQENENSIKAQFQHALRKAERLSKEEEGIVQHVQQIFKGDKLEGFYVNDWYDDETTIASFENGEVLYQGEIEEISTTAGAPAPAHKYAFSSKKKKKPKYNVYEEIDKKYEELIESYSKFVKGDSKVSPERKVKTTIREVSRKLKEIEQLINYTSKLKTESGVSKDAYGPATEKALDKMSKRLIKISERVRALGE